MASVSSLPRTNGKAEQRHGAGLRVRNEEEHMRVCPKCKKKRRKVIQVDEWEGSWDSDGLYMRDSDGILRTYEKCRVCRTIL